MLGTFSLILNLFNSDSIYEIFSNYELQLECFAARDLLSPGSLNYQCRKCIPNSSCYVYRRQTVCICDPGYFIYRGACQRESDFCLKK